MKITSGNRAAAYAVLSETRPDLSPGQLAVLIDVTAALVEDNERWQASSLLAAVTDEDAWRRVVATLVMGP